MATIVILVLVALILIALVPGWRASVANWADRLPFVATSVESTTLAPATNEGNLTLAALDGQPLPEATATPTPHPALALDIGLDDSADSMRWQIAYPDAVRGPGLGCAYLSFRLSGADALRLDQLDDVDAELAIYDGEFIFERYGPFPLHDLRGLDDPHYYELPGGGTDCQRHRFADPGEYAGLEFRLSLLADGVPFRVFRYGLSEDAITFATVTPTPLPATITPTPFPQVKITQQMNVRSGPGTSYEVLGAMLAGDVYRVTASTTARDWWQVDYQGQTGWVYAPLVNAVSVDSIAVASLIPPSPTPVPPPPPTQTPAPPPAVPTPFFPFLMSSVGRCDPNEAMTYFEGQVLTKSGDPLNGACVHVAYEGPRNTKCTGCDGATEGKWGFAPFGNLPGKRGTTVRIYVVPCPEGGVPTGGQNPSTGFGPLTPVSPVWTYVIGDSVQCTGIVFTDNRFFDDTGKEIPPPAPTIAPSANELYRFQGQGQSFTDPFVLSAEPLHFRISHTGQGTYSLQLLSSIGRNIDILASGSGPISTEKTITLEANGTYFISVIADGAWTVVVEKP